jgi:hypothetical protein
MSPVCLARFLRICRCSLTVNHSIRRKIIRHQCQHCCHQRQSMAASYRTKLSGSRFSACTSKRRQERAVSSYPRRHPREEQNSGPCRPLHRHEGACARLGVHETTVEEWAKRGLIKRHACNGHWYLYELPESNLPIKRRWRRPSAQAAYFKEEKEAKPSHTIERGVV